MKNIKSLLLIAAFLAPTISLAARITDGKDQVKLSGKTIVVKLDKGFHFVMASPAGLYMDGEVGSAEPTKKTEDKLVFDVSKVKDRSFTISYYVCDDKKTVCESHESHLKVENKKLVTIEKPIQEEPVAPK
jgi:hypothetical protein